MRPSARLIASLGASALVLAGCSLTDDVTSGSDPATASESADDATPDGGGSGELVAVATTTMLGSIVEQIAQCGGGTAETIMGIGADPHDFQPSSAQVATMVSAPLVVFSGLGLEESLLTVIESAASDGAHTLEIGPLVDPLTFAQTGASPEHDHDHDDEADDEHADDADHDATDDDHADHDHDEDGHDHDGEYDPHWWLDASRMAAAAEIIGDELAEQTGDTAYAECGTQMEQELLALDEEITTTLAAVPDENRKLVTDHQAFGYFVDRYDFELVGAVIPSVNTDAEPSSADLAELVHAIEENRVPAIFANVAAPSTLASAVANEVGFEVQVVALFTESLGTDGSGAETYQDMMRTNAQLIADALQ